MKRDNFYRRNPSDALAGMVGMSLEERGVYNTVIDLLYSTWRPVEDNRAFIANWCGCAVQKLNPILDRLIARRKLIRFEEDGASYISNSRFEEERAEVKGTAKSRSGRGNLGEKSASVGEKSPGVEENPPVLDAPIKQIQSVTPLEKNRTEQKEAIASPVGPEAATEVVLFGEAEADPPKAKPKPWENSPAFTAFWSACGDVMRKRSSKAKSWPEWRRVTAAVAPEALLAAVPRYLAQDPDYQRSGGPGVHLWLRDAKWEHWLGQTQAAAPGAGPPRFPDDDIRQRAIADLGEDWVRRNLDHCTWEGSPLRVIHAPNKFIAGNLLKEGDLFRHLAVHSVKTSKEAA